MISQAERDPSIQIRLPGSSHSSPSPPPSPTLPRSKSTSQANQTFAQRISWIVLSVILRRRRRILLFAPVIYISCMLFHMRTASFDAGPTIHRRPAPGSVYRSPQVYAKLRAVIDADNATADAVRFASVFFFDQLMSSLLPYYCYIYKVLVVIDMLYPFLTLDAIVFILAINDLETFV